jgi:hypothetical protein
MKTERYLPAYGGEHKRDFINMIEMNKQDVPDSMATFPTSRPRTKPHKGKSFLKIMYIITKKGGSILTY